MEPDFPSLADEIAETRPDMNIKVTAFTESKKFNYTHDFTLVNVNAAVIATTSWWLHFTEPVVA